MILQKLIIYGGGGFAREVAWLAESCNMQSVQFRVACFVDDNEANQGMTLNNIPVLSLREAKSSFPKAKVTVAIGAPKIRQNVVKTAEGAGFEFATLIHHGVESSRWIEVGDGTIICAGSILTTNIRLGRHVHINLDCTIGHDVLVADYVTLSPGVHVSGWVHFGKGVFVGTGATFINGTPSNPIVVGDDAIVGAGACVTKSVSAGATVVGIPARTR